ncbi:hypothetical protein BST81_12465 [Leptolyngbya sp. 'hensonii']|uniref:hypothetical protein n=1 Tax=Leptolyngbya sp. 'hensonii' TaxID=1922337 RepID=UPI00094F6A62|nr:hypothetical protein [Leptolyngbya sp. 'hensonii']OLP17868.1 hypothetical protein BST81_12465 [Leptolyngbya sp. 'hensonii']
MLRIIVTAFFALSLLMVGCSRVDRPISKAQSYTWGVASINGSNSTFVCKKVEVDIYRFKTRSSDVKAEIVDDALCAKMTKPVTLSQANPQK